LHTHSCSHSVKRCDIITLKLCIGSGCGQCIKLCPFEAFKPRKKKEKAEVDALECYGCGICRSACVKDAITLVDRAAVPAAASLWL